MEASAAAGGCTAAPALAPGDMWPPEAPFPLPYHDDFEGYANDTLPLFTSDMFGAFSVYELPTHAPLDSSPLPLRARPGIHPSAVACGDAAAHALRPRRCLPPTRGSANTRTLRQWTRAPPLGWGSGSSNMATILGNATLGNITLSVRALIETPEAAYAPAAPPYVEIGIHAGNGAGRSSSPREYYGSSASADTVWFNASHWGCTLACDPPVCKTAHALPFGLDAWHTITLGETPSPGLPGSSFMTATLDGALLFNLTASNPPLPGQMCGRNGGSGGYVLLRTGAHRAQFDDLSIVQSTL